MKAKDVRKGTVIEYKGAPHFVMDFQHRTPGNLRAFVQMRLRNIFTGMQCEEKFSSTEDLPVADVYTFEATFLYRDGDGFHFMNSQTYEQLTLQEDLVGNGVHFLQEGMAVQLATYNDNPISITLPKTVTVTVAETQPELKGATASNSPKPATTETGLTLTVPNFIKVGEKIVVDTEEGVYISRADSSK